MNAYRIRRKKSFGGPRASMHECLHVKAEAEAGRQRFKKRSGDTPQQHSTIIRRQHTSATIAWTSRAASTAPRCLATSGAVNILLSRFALSLSFVFSC